MSELSIQVPPQVSAPDSTDCFLALAWWRAWRYNGVLLHTGRRWVGGVRAGTEFSLLTAVPDKRSAVDTRSHPACRGVACRVTWWDELQIFYSNPRLWRANRWWCVYLTGCTLTSLLCLYFIIFVFFIYLYIYTHSNLRENAVGTFSLSLFFFFGRCMQRGRWH